MAAVTSDGTTPRGGGQGSTALATPPDAGPRKLFRGRPREQRKMPWRARLRRDKALILMTLPAILLLTVFGYAPMAGLVMAFENYDLYDGFLHSPWVGRAVIGLGKLSLLRGVPPRPWGGPAQLPAPARRPSVLARFLEPPGDLL